MLDMIEGGNAQPAIDWLGARPTPWRDQIQCGTLDLSGPYRKVFNEILAHVGQIADPFHWSSPLIPESGFVVVKRCGGVGDLRAPGLVSAFEWLCAYVFDCTKSRSS